MGNRTYDITERLRKKNVMPTVKVGDEVFQVRSKMTNFVTVMHEAKEVQKLSDSADYDADELLKKIYNVIKFTLGDKAVNYIKQMDLTVEATLDVMFCSITMMSGGELKDDDEESDTEKK